MEAARAGQKAITGTEADLRKLGMAEARERLLELGIKDAEIASAALQYCTSTCRSLALHVQTDLEDVLARGLMTLCLTKSGRWKYAIMQY